MEVDYDRRGHRAWFMEVDAAVRAQRCPQDTLTHRCPQDTLTHRCPQDTLTQRCPQNTLARRTRSHDHTHALHTTHASAESGTWKWLQAVTRL